MVLVTIVGMCLGWQNHRERLRRAEEADIREAAFRTFINETKDRSVAPDVFFLAFGKDDAGRYTDPSPGYLDRFRDLAVICSAASDARRTDETKRPRSNERLPITDSSTGKTGWIVTTRVDSWIDDCRVRIFVTCDYGRGAEGGFSGPMEKVDGRWQVIEQDYQWFSE